MIKEWFIFINGNQEGPYSLKQLRDQIDITPDTLVWKDGFSNWIAIRYVPELKEVFKDKPQSVPLEDLIKKPEKTFSQVDQDQGTLTLQRDPIQFFLWLLVILFLITYFILQLRNK